MHRVLEGQVQLRLHVGAPLGPAGSRRPAAAAEEAPEEVAQVAHVLHAERAAARRAEATAHRAVPADLVVLLALLGVAEHVVGRADLLEALLRSRVGVGVVLLGQLAVGARDLLVGRRRARRRAPCSSPSRTIRAVRPRVSSPPHADHGGAQHLPLPAVPGAQDLLDHRARRRHRARPPSARRRRAPTGRRGRRPGRRARGPPWRGCRAAWPARRAAPWRPRSRRATRSGGPRPGRACRAPAAACPPGRRRPGPPAPPAGARCACGSSRSRPGCAGARAGTRPARAPAAPGGSASSARRSAARRRPVGLGRSRRRRPPARVSRLLGRLGLGGGRLLLGHGLVAEAHCSSTISASTTSSSERALGLTLGAGTGTVAAAPPSPPADCEADACS